MQPSGCSPRPALRRGFSLLELLVVLALLAVLAALALPSYEDSVLRAGRADGRAALLQVAAEQERYYSVNNRYSANAEPWRTPPQAAVDSPEGRYRITVAACAGGTIDHCFVASATALGRQRRDACVTLTLDATGRRSASAQECWQR